jgi:signal transduction histidine kinase
LAACQKVSGSKSRNEERDTFAHFVAHDLKNPLSAVVGYVGMLRDSSTAMAEQDVRKSIQVIERISRSPT